MGKHTRRDPVPCKYHCGREFYSELRRRQHERQCPNHPKNRGKG